MVAFTASNGIRVDVSGDDYIQFEDQTGELRWARSMEPEEIDALREYFRSQDDVRAGRSRYSGNPDLVIYPVLDRDAVLVVSEKFGEAVTYGRADTTHSTPSQGWAISAADEYFEAHPEPKPWHSAKAGEIWIVERPRLWSGIGGQPIEEPRSVSSRLREEPRFVDANGNSPSYPITDKEIVNARRIWPEEVSS